MKGRSTMVAAEPKKWDADRAVRDLVQRSPELRETYRRLGYSPRVENRCRKSLAELNDIEVAIPDFAKFQTSLDSVIAAIERYERGEEKVDPLYSGARGLFDSVVDARGDAAAVHQVLNENFRDRLPFSLEARAITRRPRSPDVFSRALRELEQLFGMPWVPQTQETREELLEGVSRLRLEIDREDGFPVTALQSLELLIEDTVFHVADEGQDEKKSSLDHVLCSFVDARHEFQPQHPSFSELVAEDAKLYVDSSWMHSKWLSRFILRHLLDGEVARKVPVGLSQRGILVSVFCAGLLNYFGLGAFALLWIAALVGYVGRAIWQTHTIKPLVVCHQEILADSYDGAEVARRLRDLERRGIFVNSIILRLLELEAPSRENAA